MHQYVHQVVFQQWDEEQQGPPPVWVPSDEEKSQTNISALMPGDDFSAVHQLSVQEPEFYWTKMLSSLRIRFEKPPQKMLLQKGKDENVTWLPGAELNIAQSCFAQRRSADVVLIWQSEEGEIQRMIDHSFALVIKGLSKKVREGMEVRHGREALYGGQN